MSSTKAPTPTLPRGRWREAVAAPPTGPRGGDRRLPFPRVSVVVPTYNRARLLIDLLAALARQVYPASSMEVIIVDNSSDDETPAVVRERQAVLPFPVRFLRKRNDGPAASRNLGARLASGDLVAFTDSDCLPDPAWVRNAARAFRDGVAIVCGPVIAAREATGLLSTHIDETAKETGLYPSANLLVRREAFLQVGGFDEQFGLYPWGGLVAGEDTDLAWRIKRAGYQSSFAADVVVRHQPSALDLRAWLLRPVRVQILPRLVRTIPELRQMFLWKRVFVSRLHFAFHLAWIGVVVGLASRRKLPAAAAIPWLVGVRKPVISELRRRGPFRALAVLGLITEGFVMHTLVLIAASIRYRRVVL